MDKKKREKLKHDLTHNRGNMYISHDSIKELLNALDEMEADREVWKTAAGLAEEQVQRWKAALDEVKAYSDVYWNYKARAEALEHYIRQSGGFACACCKHKHENGHICKVRSKDGMSGCVGQDKWEFDYERFKKGAE